MNTILISVVHILAKLAFILVLTSVVLSYFMNPYHPVRQAIDRIVNPLLSPIRKIVPPIANIDFSPIVLILLIQLVEYLLVMLLNYLG
jgi:YggT family protein